MNSRALSDEIMRREEFWQLGGPARSLSYPLLKTVNGREVIVFFVYDESLTVPSDYVVCDPVSGASMYLKGPDGYELLGLKEYVSEEKIRNSAVLAFADILGEDSPLLADAPAPEEPDGLPCGDETGKTPVDLPDDMYERFDAAFADGQIDRDSYHAYIKELISCTDWNGKHYLKAFL